MISTITRTGLLNVELRTFRNYVPSLNCPRSIYRRCSSETDKTERDVIGVFEAFKKSKDNEVEIFSPEFKRDLLEKRYREDIKFAYENLDNHFSYGLPEVGTPNSNEIQPYQNSLTQVQ